MVDGSEESKRRLAFELYNSRVFKKRSMHRDAKEYVELLQLLLSLLLSFPLPPAIFSSVHLLTLWNR